MGIASLVLGILALVPLPFPIFGPICAIVGLILGVVGRNQAKEQGAPTGIATAGIVLCIISLALSLLVMLACAACVVTLL
ncbi:MAG: DUF4190 domain-containing protein [Oscillospiraceae bacterium]|nr:DUF4190 domain-containing protein [Oscillospiraceae bacterium]